MGAVRQFQHARHAGNANRPAADNRVPEFHFVPGGIQEQRRGCRGRGGLAPVEARNFSPGGIETAATMKLFDSDGLGACAIASDDDSAMIERIVT
jgi:hypothetical protein